MAGRRPSVSEVPEAPKIRIPNQTQDPIWSVKPWPIIVTVGGRDVEFPAASAADWLSVLMAESVDLDDLVRFLATDGEALLSDETIGAELYESCLSVITAASGRPWWLAMRLINVAKANWNTVGAEMLYRGFFPGDVSLSAWLDVLLVVIIKMMDPSKVTMFTMQLEQPPPEFIDEESQEQEMEMDRNQFLSLGR